MTDNVFIQGLNEEQLERYNNVKLSSLKLYPQIERDNVKREMAEHFFRYYAINKEVPAPDDTTNNDKEDVIIAYKTPENIKDTLKSSD